MKKITQNLLLAILASLVIFSCGKDDEPTAAAPSVTVTAVVDGSDVTSGSDVEVGSSITLTVSINAPGGVNGLYVNDDTYSRSQLGAESGDTEASITFDPIEITAAALGSTVIWEFQAVDDAGQVSTTVTFTITPVSPEVNSFSQVLIGGFQNSTLGSFYNSVDNIVYTSDDAIDNADKVDLLFYYSDVALYTIAALDNAQAEATLNSQTGGSLSNFDPQNPTRFKTFLTAPDFDAIETVADLEDAYAGDAASSEESRVTELTANDVFGFVLASARGEKIGLIKVTETSGTAGNDRAITIEVKIVPSE